MSKATTSKYTNTELQYYKWAELEACENDAGVCFYVHKKTGRQILSNISRMSNEAQRVWDLKYFLLDSDEAKQLTKPFLGTHILSEEGREMVKSLTDFMANSTGKRIYMRQLPHPAESTFDFGFLADDVLEIIPLVLEQQGTPIREDNALLAKYRDLWKLPIDILHRVLPTKEVLQVFEQFDINKTLITVVPDLQYHYSITQRFNGTGLLETYNHNAQKTVYKQEALWLAFKECICGFDWSEVRGFEETRRQIIEVMRKMNAPGVTMFTLDAVQVYLRHIKRLPFFSTPEANRGTTRKLDYFFVKTKGLNSIFGLLYQKMADQFHLTKYATQREIPVWKARVYMATGWINQFFGTSEPGLRQHLMDGVRYMCHPELSIWMEVQEYLFPEFIRGSNTPKSEPPLATPPTEQQAPPTTLAPLSRPSETPEPLQKVMSPASTTSETVSKPSGSASKPPGAPTSVENDSKTFESLKKDSNPSKPVLSPSGIPGTVSAPPKLSEELSGAPKNISRPSGAPTPLGGAPGDPGAAIKASKPSRSTSRGSDAPPPPPKPSTDPSNESKLCKKCNRMGTALNDAKTELTKAQAKANKFEAQATSAKEVEKKMKKLRKENENLQKGMEEMKVEKEKNEKREEDLKGKIGELNLKVGELEGKLENEQQEKVDLEQDRAMLRRNFEKLQVHVAMKDSKRPSTNRPSVSLDPSCSAYMSANNWLLAKEEFENDEIFVAEKKKMIETLLSKTTDPDIRQYCQFELSQYVGSIQLYETILNLNIEKINFTGDTSDLQPLPNYPHLSQKFVEYFNEFVVKAEAEASNPDNECYICQDTFRDGQKRVFCPQCKKPVHLKCEEEWEEAQKKSMIKELSCGHCRGKEKLKAEENKEN